jgi:hypothetical protein
MKRGYHIGRSIKGCTVYERENEVEKRGEREKRNLKTETCKCQKEAELQERREKLVNPGKAEGTVKSHATAY